MNQAVDSLGSIEAVKSKTAAPWAGDITFKNINPSFFASHLQERIQH